MKNIFVFLIVIILFVFCFILPLNFKEEYLPVVPVNAPVVTKTTVVKNVNPKPKTKRKAIPNKPLLKIVHAKKFFYPHFLQKGRITLYLNNPTEYSYPSNSSRMPVCRFLLEEINNAKENIEFSIYGIDNQNEFITALNNASKRGVVVRGVTDSDENGVLTYPDIKKLDSSISITTDNSKKIMHDKFFIVDDKFVLTGSMNISQTGCGGYNANSVTVIRDKEVVSVYKKEFEQMYNGKFKKDKTNYSSPLIELGEDVTIGVYFSPVSSAYHYAISDLIKNAVQDIRVSIFVLTNKEMVRELIDASKRGVNVRIIIDAVGAGKNRSLVHELRENGIKVKVENWGGKNHEKTISIDGSVVVIGSANFSYSGFLRNDENVIVIKNKELTTFYDGFFDSMFNSIDDIYLERFPLSEGWESGNSCSDKLDNDFDGNIDLYDNGCKK